MDNRSIVVYLFKLLAVSVKLYCDGQKLTNSRVKKTNSPNGFWRFS